MDSNYMRVYEDDALSKLLYFVHKNFKVIVLVISLMAFVSVFFIGDKLTREVSASTANQKYFVCIEISEGDTLWDIADMYISEEYSSTDEYVAEVKQLNHLSDDKIYSGATLVVPYYAP